MSLLDDPGARAAVGYALTVVGCARAGITEVPAYDGPDLDDPELIPLAIAEVAAIFAGELDRAGGDASQVMSSIYLAVNRGETEGAGHG